MGHTGHPPHPPRRHVWEVGPRWDSLLRDQPCLTGFPAAHTVSRFTFKYDCFPLFYIYTHETHAYYTRVSSLHLFCIYSPRDHFLIHGKKRTISQTSGQWPGYWGSRAVAAPSLCMLSTDRSLRSAFVWPPPPQPHRVSSNIVEPQLHLYLPVFPPRTINTISVSKL